MDFYDRLENHTDQGNQVSSAEVALCRVLKLPLHEKQMEALFCQWLALV